jgi:hypothetical protein
MGCEQRDVLAGKEVEKHIAMAKKRGRDSNEVAELLKDLLITHLGIAGLPQQAIRAIVGCDINRVNRIVKHLKSARKKEPA